MRNKARPPIDEYVFIIDLKTTAVIAEGYVTDLLSSQFIIRETLGGLPQFFFYTEPWRHAKK